MLSVSDAQARILPQVTNPAPPELIPVGKCLARVTADDVHASTDVPPTDNSAVDGYAVTSSDTPTAGTRALEVVGDVAAGSVFPHVLGPGQALRILTGAPRPAAAGTADPPAVAT